MIKIDHESNQQKIEQLKKKFESDNEIKINANSQIKNNNSNSLKNKFYLTTAIAYTNGNPHIGHAYEFLMADFISKSHKLLGKDVFFLTGTDEHGQKIKKTAEESNENVITFVDKISQKFKDLCKTLDIDYSRFIRTTDEDHINTVRKFTETVFETGDIYKSEYSGNYCIFCEAYYPKTQLIDEKLCPECKRETKLMTESAYFFKLSKYQEILIELIESDKYKIHPIERKNEILSRLKNDELKDLCITRQKSVMDWGIDFPIDDEFVVYVWFDALTNYITGAKYGTIEFNKYWPCDCHIIGKDIAWFHAVIWPAMLISANIKTPKLLLVHGFINDKNGDKMSKSKGNVINPYELIDKFGTDVLRYYTLRVTPIGNDIKFNEEELIEICNSELSNSLGNLISRAHTLVQKYCNSEYKKYDETKIDKILSSDEVKLKITELIENYKSKEYIDYTFVQIAKINKYINDKSPWTIKDENELKKVIYSTLDAIRIINILIKPFLIKTHTKITEQLGLSNDFDIDDIKSGKLKDGKISFEKIILFPKIEENKKILPLKLINGKIKNILDHPEAEKLYILKVDIGENREKQLVAGLKTHFTKEQLLNKNIIIVDNLKHAKLRNVMSEGMILACEDENGKVELLHSIDESLGKNAVINGFSLKDETIKIEDFSKLKLEIKDQKLCFNGFELMINEKNIVSDSIKNTQKVR